MLGILYYATSSYFLTIRIVFKKQTLHIHFLSMPNWDQNVPVAVTM